jgi:hypothetical protein
MSLAGLTLGVTLVVAIELLNHSARTNFVAARSQLAGGELPPGPRTAAWMSKSM